jgi:hypothetical protein
MTDLRENLGWLIGSVATAVALALGWLYQSGILNTLVGIVVGAGIAYFVQTRTQKRAWKREYSVKIAEQVYGFLFREVKSIIEALENKHHSDLFFGGWRQMQEDHRYFMVDEKFRASLDRFLEKVEKYSRAVNRFRSTILPKIANEETRIVFNTKTDEIAELLVKYHENYRDISTSPNMIECLISETHPKDYALEGKADISNVEFNIRVPRKDEAAFYSKDLKKFDKFWESCLRRMKEDETYRFVMAEDSNLLEEAKKVRKEIVERIEEPWKI